ncbi:PEP-CTERM sorting domain-containing protein [Pontiellaceae bacterium B12227]|nr:PEP-CTERM sorting domain-containing protein [Pontiellaceae bacterium B12227]
MNKLNMILGCTLLTAVGSFGAVVMDYDFNERTADTGYFQEETSGYNYTSNNVYTAGTGVGANTLAFQGGSSGTDYGVRNKGTGHETALFWRTLNPQGANAGIYLQKIDMTDGGANGSQVVRVSWSFDILGYDQNGGVDPSSWTVKVRYDNTSENLNISDAWYSTGALAQTFSFNDDSTGHNSTDGTWTTVIGSYDVAIGTGAALGGIQISTDNGAYTSAGGIFLDNITVDVAAIPEPATLSLIGAFGAAVIFIRKRFMI